MTPPHTAYALSKYVGEIILESVAASHAGTIASSLRLNFVSNPESMERMRQRHPEEHSSPNLWAYVDSRDVAETVSSALRSEREGHRAYNICAADTMCHIPTRELVDRWFGVETQLPDDFPPFGSLVDCSRAERELGWKPEFTWRTEIV